MRSSSITAIDSGCGEFWFELLVQKTFEKNLKYLDTKNQKNQKNWKKFKWIIFDEPGSFDTRAKI